MSADSRVVVGDSSFAKGRRGEVKMKNVRTEHKLDRPPSPPSCRTQAATPDQVKH